MLAVLARFLGVYRLPLLFAGAAAALTAAYAAGWRMGGDHIKAQLLTQTQEALWIQYEAFRQDLEKRDRLLAERERLMQQRRDQVYYWKRRFEQAVQDDQNCAKWAETPVPRCALERLRRDLSTRETGSGRSSGVGSERD